MLSDKLRQSGQSLEKLRIQKEFKEHEKQIQNNLDMAYKEIQEIKDHIIWVQIFQSVTGRPVDLKLKQIGQKHLKEIAKGVRGLEDFNTVISIKNDYKKDFYRLLEQTWNNYYKAKVVPVIKTLEFVSELDKTQIQPLMSILESSKNRPKTRMELVELITALNQAEIVIKKLDLNSKC